MRTLVRLPSCASIREVQAEVIKEAAPVPMAPTHIPAAPVNATPPAPSMWNNLAGMGGRRWAGLGALAGGAIGALAPGKDDDGESRSPLTGALRGAVAGGLAGGLGGLAAKRMWGPAGAMKTMTGANTGAANLAAGEAQHGVNLAGAQQRLNQGLGEHVYNPGAFESFRDQGHGFWGSLGKTLNPFGGRERLMAKVDTSRAREGEQLQNAQFHEQHMAHLQAEHQKQLAGLQPQAPAPAAPAAAPPAPPTIGRAHVNAIAGQHIPGVEGLPEHVALHAAQRINSGDIPTAAEINTYRMGHIPQPAQMPAEPQQAEPQQRRPDAAMLRQQMLSGEMPTQAWKPASVVLPIAVLCPLKLAAPKRRPFSAPKPTVAERVQGAFSPRKPKDEPAAAAATPEPPKPAEPAKPKDAPAPEASADDKKTAASPPIAATMPPGAGPATAVAPLKTAEPVVPAPAAAEPAKTAEPVIKPIKLAALAA